MPISDRVEHHYNAVLTGLVLLYTTIELIYVCRLPLVMDEFDGAYEVFRLLRELPYRDFSPYKTVLGYYINLPAALPADDVWQRIMFLKTQLVLINAACLAAAAVVLRRIVARPAVIILAMALLIFNTAFLERSGELRVDMLTAWAGLASLLLLLLGRSGWSGAACGLSFCISQKGAFYFLAANAAMLADLLRSRTKQALRDLLLFNAGFGAVIGVYVGFWSLFSPSVIRTVFISATGSGALTGYDIRARFWWQVIQRNPMYFILIALGLWTLAVLVRRRTAGRKHVLVLVYSIVVLALMIAYPQPWPYHFVLMLPATFVLHAVFFDARHTDAQPFGLPPVLMMTTLLLAIVYPAHRIPIAMARDNSFQEYNVKLAGATLQPGDTYLAGTDIVHDHEQTPVALQRLGGHKLAELRTSAPHILAPLIEDLDAGPPKLVIANYRIDGLPPAVMAFIDAHYSRLSGCTYAYAPLVGLGEGWLHIAFAGRYLVDASTAVQITVDGQAYESGSTLSLAKGVHQIRTPALLRLRLIPEGIENVLDPRFAAEEEFYPHVYDY